MSSARITIIRHGETEWNLAKKLQGHLDSPLTENGIQQANLLAEALKNKPFDFCYSSDLRRASNTAKIINKHLNLNIIVNSNLRERAFGVFESLTREELKLKHPKILEAYLKKDYDFEVPGGESLKEFYTRIVNEIESIAQKHANKNILMVAHGGVLDCIIRKTFNLPLNAERCYTIYNTSVNCISIVNGKWILEEWGNLEHLKQNIALNEID
jgi:probable phosphoglycerate mutase